MHREIDMDRDLESSFFFLRGASGGRGEVWSREKRK